MTLPKVTPDGVQIRTKEEITEELVEGFKGIYGDDISVDPEDPDGQRIAIIADIIQGAEQYGLFIANSLDPDKATGEQLKRRLKFNSITMRAPTRSQADLEITVDFPLTIPEGYAVEDELGQLWKTETETEITTSPGTVTVFAENFGAVEASAGTINEPVTIIRGVVAVTNPGGAIVGTSEEKEMAVRIRRRQSAAIPAYSTIGSLTGLLLDLPGVIDAIVYENDEPDYDPVLDMAAHSIWAVVDGGDVSEIARTMAISKTAGTPRKGDTTGTYIETIQRPDGSEFTYTHVMLFDRPEVKNLYVRIKAGRKDPAVPFDAESIKEAVTQKQYRISENGIAGRLFDFAYRAPSVNYYITEITISDDGQSFTSGVVEAEGDTRFVILVANVEVEDIDD